MIFHKAPPLWRTVLTMLVGGVGLIVLIVLLFDQVCYMDITDRQAMYPDAEIVAETYDMFRPRAMGITNPGAADRRGRRDLEAVAA